MKNKILLSLAAIFALSGCSSFQQESSSNWKFDNKQESKESINFFLKEQEKMIKGLNTRIDHGFMEYKQISINSINPKDILFYKTGQFMNNETYLEVINRIDIKSIDNQSFFYFYKNENEKNNQKQFFKNGNTKTYVSSIQSLEQEDGSSKVDYDFSEVFDGVTVSVSYEKDENDKEFIKLYFLNEYLNSIDSVEISDGLFIEKPNRNIRVIDTVLPYEQSGHFFKYSKEENVIYVISFIK